MALPDFLRFHCINSDSANCPSCPRDFVIPVSAIEGIMKDSAGKAIVMIKGIHYCPLPQCVNKLRFIETELAFEDAISAIGGDVEDLGNINMTYQDNMPKG